ncbi:hypothetical protein Hanom_Chr07g00615231 [Helianthus anomalus]
MVIMNQLMVGNCLRYRTRARGYVIKKSDVEDRTPILNMMGLLRNVLNLYPVLLKSYILNLKRLMNAPCS